MSSLATNLNSLTVIGSTAQKIVNWVTTADFAVGKFVHTRRNCRQLFPISYTPPVRLDSTVESRRRRRCVLSISLLILLFLNAFAVI